MVVSYESRPARREDIVESGNLESVPIHTGRERPLRDLLSIVEFGYTIS